MWDSPPARLSAHTKTYLAEFALFKSDDAQHSTTLVWGASGVFESGKTGECDIFRAHPAAASRLCVRDSFAQHSAAYATKQTMVWHWLEHIFMGTMCRRRRRTPNTDTDVKSVCGICVVHVLERQLSARVRITFWMARATAPRDFSTAHDSRLDQRL